MCKCDSTTSEGIWCLMFHSIKEQMSYRLILVFVISFNSLMFDSIQEQMSYRWNLVCVISKEIHSFLSRVTPSSGQILSQNPPQVKLSLKINQSISWGWFIDYYKIEKKRMNMICAPFQAETKDPKIRLKWNLNGRICL